VFWHSRVGPHAARVHLSAGAEHLDLQALITHAAQGPLILRDRGVFTTTYATTYGWVSAGIRRKLMAPSRSKKRVDGTKRDRTGLNRCTERLATNQKAAGSSPAERAAIYLQIQRFCFVKCTRRSARTTRLTTYPSRTRLACPVRSVRIRDDPDAPNGAWVGSLWPCAWTHDRTCESNKTPEAGFLRSLRELSIASNRLGGELGELTSSVKAAARSPMDFSSIRPTI
jgi:hypothetical protein